MSPEDQLPLFDLPLAVLDVASKSAEPPRGGAWFSPCRKYRYSLSRVLDPTNERVATIIGCNPSTAGEDEDDPTIRKDCGFAKRWGCGRVFKVNAAAYIATDPGDMRCAARDGFDIVGPENETAIRQAIGRALLSSGVLVLTCGNDTTESLLRAVWRQVRFGGVPAMCLGTNKNGSPTHNLYLSYETPLVPYSPPWASEEV